MALTKIHNRMHSGAVANVLDYGAIGDGSTDDTTAFQNAIDAVTSQGGSDVGGTVFVPKGIYKTTSTLLMKHGVEMVGENFHSPGSRTAASLIVGHHNGVSVISFKGAQGCALRDIGINIGSGFEPKTHLLFGRDTSASAGLHEIKRVFTQGVASVAAVYSIASEQNSFEDCIFDLTETATGKICFFTSQADDIYTVDSLVASSNVLMSFKNVDFKNRIDDAASYGIYIRSGGSTGAITFVDCYGHQAGGAYVSINNGQTDGLPSLGGICFYNQCGEILEDGSGTNSPVNGYYMWGTVPMRGLVINGGRMAQRAGVSPKTINSTVNFEDCIVDLPQNKDNTQSSGALITSTLQSLIRSSVNHVTLDVAKSTTMTGDLTMSGAFKVLSFSDTGASTGKIISSGSNSLESSSNSASTSTHQEFYNPNGKVGSITTSGSATAYATSSDYRLKENVVSLSNAMTRLGQLNPSRFNFISEPSQTVDGFIAHEVSDVVPEAVVGDKDAVDENGNIIPQGIDQSKLVPLLVAALQQLEARVAALES